MNVDLAMSSHATQLGPGGSLVFGLFCAGLGWLLFAGARKFQRSSRQVTGVVVGVDQHLSRSGSDGRRPVMYAPVVSWTDEHGVSRQFVGQSSKSDPTWVTVGEELPVRYIAGNPESARTNSRNQYYAAYFCWACAVALFGYAVIRYVR